MSSYLRDLGIAISTIGLWIFDKMPQFAAAAAFIYSIYCMYHLWDQRRKKRK